jgi:hypothetical protein
MNNPSLAFRCGLISSTMFNRRIGPCWEATRAPQWARRPQAWAETCARAGLLRDRQQCEKSQGFGDRVPESFLGQTQTITIGNRTFAF